MLIKKLLGNKLFYDIGKHVQCARYYTLDNSKVLPTRHTIPGNLIIMQKSILENIIIIIAHINSW